MRARRFYLFIAICAAFLAAGCSNRAPLNPPRLVMSSDTDMAIQLFMQSTILLSNYYGYNTIRYSELRERSNRAGYDLIPFMPPETVRATPELVGFFNTYENNSPALDQVLKTYGGYKVLVKYYIRTGLRASQLVCRNYLLNLEERSEYLEFLKKEIGVAAALSTAVLALVNANATLSKAFLIARTGVDGGIDAYEEYRFLNIDREAARALVEAAQNALAQNFLKQVDAASPDSNLVTGGYTFSDALHAVSMIEYQCTRSGIRSLLTRSINNSPSNLAVDEVTGTLIFRSTKSVTIVHDVPPSDRKVTAPPPPVTVPSGNGNTGKPGTSIPAGVGDGTPPAGQSKGPSQKGASSQNPGGQNPSTSNKGKPAPKSQAECPSVATLPDAAKLIENRNQILAASATLLANPSSTFGLMTAGDAGKQIVTAFTCINTVFQQASGLPAAQPQKDEYQRIQKAVTAHMAAIQGIVQQLKSATANRQTALDVATQLSLQLNGTQGVTGAIEVVRNALTLLGPSG
jgi:hypothetical protein